MIKRIATAIFGIPTIIACVYFGGLALALPLLALCLIGQREVYFAVLYKEARIFKFVGYAASCFYIAAIFLEAPFNDLIIAVFFIILIIWASAAYPRIKTQDVLGVAFGFFYISFMLSFVLITRAQYGFVFALLIFVATVCGDSCAYLTGKHFGKNFLKNTSSPSKTVEGTIGGFWGAGLGGILYGYITERFFDAPSGFLLFSALIALLAAGAAFFGDLFASLIKRQAGIKDFGALLPGHGGALDRFDSAICAAPIIYICARIFI